MKAQLSLETQTSTIVDQLVEIVRNRIVSGELKPGQKLSEPGLSGEYGISRAPAREALIKLEEQGLIRKTYSGREVARITQRELRELFDIKIALEGFVAYQLAGKLDSPQLKVLTRAIQAMRKHFRPLKIERFRQASSEFHDQVIRIYGNDRITELYQATVGKIRWTTAISLGIAGRPELTIKEHEEILKALKGGESNRACSVFMEHSTSSMERIMSRFPSDNAQNSGDDDGGSKNED